VGNCTVEVRRGRIHSNTDTIDFEVIFRARQSVRDLLCCGQRICVQKIKYLDRNFVIVKPSDGERLLSSGT
jgi:hypothetical protein